MNEFITFEETQRLTQALLSELTKRLQSFDCIISISTTWDYKENLLTAEIKIDPYKVMGDYLALDTRMRDCIKGTSEAIMYGFRYTVECSFGKDEELFDVFSLI